MTILLATEHEDPPKLTGLWLSYFFYTNHDHVGLVEYPLADMRPTVLFFFSCIFYFL